MQKVSIAKQVLADIVKLDDPKTAAALLGLAVLLVGPLLGWHPDGQVQTSVVGALVAVGLVANFVQKQIAQAVGQTLEGHIPGAVVEHVELPPEVPVQDAPEEPQEPVSAPSGAVG